MPSVDIIIVNWNAGEYLRQCIESIAASNATSFGLNRVVVIDNASGDGSVDTLNVSGLPLTILRNSENRGFAAACNQGAQGSTANYLLFLNPDTRVSRDSIFIPMSFMQLPENQRIGIVGIQLVDENGTIARSCARFPTPGKMIGEMIGLGHVFPRLFPGHFMADWDHRSGRDVDQVMGAFFLVRRELFESLGRFDERFFVYYEDLDFSYRAHEAGFRSHFLSDAHAYHKGKGTTDRDKAARLLYVLRSRILFSYKHFSWFWATAVMLLTLTIEPIFRFGWTLLKGSGSTFYETAKGYGLLWLQIPQVVAEAGRKNT